MAYKFSLGPQVISGTLTVSGNLNAKGGGADQPGVVSGAFGISGSALRLGNYYINDQGQGKFGSGIAVASGGQIGAGSDPDMLTLTQADNITVASNVSFVVAEGKFEIGDGNAMTSTAAELNLLDGFADHAVTLNADSMVIYDAGTSAFRRELLSDYAAGIAGDGLGASAGALSVTVDDTGIEINSDTLRLKDNGVTLAKMAGITRGSIIVGDSSGDPSLLAKGTAAQFLQSDGSDPSYVTISGDATIAAGGALTIANDAVEQAMIADDAVGADQLAANAVVNASIASNAAIDMDKLDGGSLASSLSDLAQGDLLYAGDVDDSNNLKSITFSEFEDAIFGNVSGDATIAAGGALTIASDAVEPSMINIFDDSLAATDTHFMIADGTDYSSFALSGDVTCTNAGVVTIANDAVETAMLNDNVISGQDELAQGSLVAADEFLISDGGTLKRFGVDSLAKDALALTTEAAMDLAADYIVFLDGGATGETKKEQWSDLVSSLAGAGLTATNGVLSADAAGTPTSASHGTRLSEGFNYLTGTLAAPITVSLPEAGSGPTVGDVYYLKAANGLDGTKSVTIACSGAHKIDGLSSIKLESPYSAVSLVYMASGSWSLF